MIRPMVPDIEQESCVFPKCARNCKILLELGAGECESVCPEKFEKDGTPKKAESCGNPRCAGDCAVHERRDYGSENGC